MIGFDFASDSRMKSGETIIQIMKVVLFCRVKSFAHHVFHGYELSLQHQGYKHSSGYNSMCLLIEFCQKRTLHILTIINNKKQNLMNDKIVCRYNRIKCNAGTEGFQRAFLENTYQSWVCQNSTEFGLDYVLFVNCVIGTFPTAIILLDTRKL